MLVLLNSKIHVMKYKKKIQVRKLVVESFL